MNKRATTIALATLLLLMAVLLILALFRNQALKERDRLQAVTPKTRPYGVSEADRSASLWRQDKSEAVLNRDTEPKPAEHFSSKVIAEIQEGETLVMGGYRTADGLHEFTLLTPTTVTYAHNGKEYVKLNSKIVSIDSNFAHRSGMNSMTTRYPSADQHAEAWSQSEVQSMLKSALESKRIKLISNPSISGGFGESLSIGLPRRSDSSYYTYRATIERNSNGGFSIESHVVRTPAPTP